MNLKDKNSRGSLNNITAVSSSKCPPHVRLASVTYDVSQLTQVEQEHIMNGCPRCLRIIERYHQERQKWDNLLEQDHSNNATHDAKNHPRHIKVQLGFSWQMISGMAIGTVAAGFLFFHFRANQTNLVSKPPVNTVASRPTAFADSANVHISMQNGILRAEGLPPNQQALIGKALSGSRDPIFHPVVNTHVGPTAGDNGSEGPRAPQHLQPSGSVVIGSPNYSWSPAMNFSSREYRVEYRQLSPLMTASEYKTMGSVRAPKTRMEGTPLAAGMYSWHVRVIGRRPNMPNEFVSTEASFLVVEPKFSDSDLVMGVAYTQMEQWDKAEERFKHLVHPQVSDINGLEAAKARKETGAILLRWLQTQRQNIGK